MVRLPLIEVAAADAPGTILIIWRKSRPFIGRSCTVDVFTTAVSELDVVSTETADADTSTVDCGLGHGDLHVEIRSLRDGDFDVVDLLGLKTRRRDSQL